MARYYEGGSLVVCRLAPQDYHRFHVPVDGSLGIIIPIPGSYYTVNPMAVRQRIDVFTENTRTITYIHSDLFGKVAFVAIGAMLVGSVQFIRQEGERVTRGEELGFFAFGGSTIILLFPKASILLDRDLLENSEQQLETLIQMSDSIGRLPNVTLPEPKTSAFETFIAPLEMTSGPPNPPSPEGQFSANSGGTTSSDSDHSS